MTSEGSQGEGPRSRVFLVDDHAIVRQGLGELINGQPDLVTCGEADGPAQAMKEIGPAAPDVVVVDIILKGGDGIELTRLIHDAWPKLPILILSMHEESLYAERALHAGAMGYVMKQEPQDTVMMAIRRLLKGEVHLSEAASA